MLSVIHANNGWGWSNLPACYRESPYLTIDNEVIFKHIDHVKADIKEQVPDAVNVEDEVKENSSAQQNGTRLNNFPKPTYPKRTSVTRCCDLLARTKTQYMNAQSQHI